MKILKSLLVIFLDFILTGATWFFVKDYFINKLPNDHISVMIVALLTHAAIIIICLVLYGVLLSYLIM